ncbi:AbrB/MazE/SpoVT family DNA-binding domain-containing protein [Deinococcus frigens]|uniref:AbrB/MazE/SpoVT family DNA-binding domain-containing protein n=1 Tax=Deinococcus frigens TaxID=249403 RepID=UPI00049745F8|nr:AbrB/MazE/SpoVT family DNA-binding domain-containing protein [Deinococcus frigens]
MTTTRKVTAAISSKSQLTLPRAVRERLGVDRGDLVEFTLDEQGVHLLPLRKGDNPFLTWLARTPAPAQATTAQTTAAQTTAAQATAAQATAAQATAAQASADARGARHAGLDPEERRLLQAGPGARVVCLGDLDLQDAAETGP